MKIVDRRLKALESHAISNRRSTYRGLVTLCESGKLDMPDLTDTELWWLIAGKEEPLPDDAEQERRLAVIHDSN
jgi:hypothetical protein